MLEQEIMLHCVPMNINVLCSQICLDVGGLSLFSPPAHCH